ncbi:MAG: sigma-70 family RNA polymerase sigma factor [Clostridia bacterium]|nr:sigma-70 family RNA polymerase sigma factor [Clostridia bacterium]
MFRIAINLLSNKEDSEECVNDTYLRTWNSIPEERPDSLKLYTGRITRNLAINRIKSKSAEKRGQQLTEMLSELSECIPSSDTPASDYDLKLLRECIRTYVSSLDDLNQCIFVRRYWMGEAVGSIAGQTALSENAVSGRLFRMRGELKQRLMSAGYTV